MEPPTHTHSHPHNVAITSIRSEKFAYSIIQFKVFKSNLKHQNEVALYIVSPPVMIANGRFARF